MCGLRPHPPPKTHNLKAQQKAIQNWSIFCKIFVQTSSKPNLARGRWYKGQTKCRSLQRKLPNKTASPDQWEVNKNQPVNSTFPRSMDLWSWRGLCSCLCKWFEKRLRSEDGSKESFLRVTSQQSLSNCEESVAKYK